MKKSFKLNLKDDNGKPVVLEVRNDFATIEAIEEACGEGIVSIVTRLSNGKITFTELAKLVHAALEAKGDSRRTRQEVGQLLHNTGFMDVIKEQLDDFICSLIIPQSGSVESGKAEGTESSPGKK